MAQITTNTREARMIDHARALKAKNQKYLVYTEYKCKVCGEEYDTPEDACKCYDDHPQEQREHPEY